jgi:large subunit ribosomal protein L29
MSEKEMEEKLSELRIELLREMGIKAAGGAPENPGRIRELRKTIARIKTIQNERRGGERKD